MNYLKLVRAFWKKHKQECFSGNETLLYWRLVDLFNDEGSGDNWPTELRVTDGSVCTEVGLSPNAMKPARIALQQRGLIEFGPTGKGFRSGGIYKLVDATETQKRTSASSSGRTSDSDELYTSSSPTSSESDELSEGDKKDSQEDSHQVSQEERQIMTNSHIYIEPKHQTPNEETKIIPLTSFEVAQTGTSAFSVVVPNEQEKVSFVEAELPSSNPHSAPPLSSPIDPPPEPEKPKPPTLEQRIEAFTETVRDFYRANREKYPVELYTNFIRYWTEPTNNRKRFRREIEKTWDLSGRLAYWHENDQKRQFNQTNGKSNQGNAKPGRVEPVQGQSFGNWSGSRFSSTKS